MADLLKIYLRIAPGQFHCLKFILEGYDNLAVLSSHCNKTGVVLVRYTQGLEKDLFDLLESIAPKLRNGQHQP